MPNPVPGQYYIAGRTDSIRGISWKAYGYDRSDLIVDANNDLLSTRGKSLEGLPIIYTGDRLWIPESDLQFSDRLAADTDDEIAIRIDGEVFKGWKALNIARNINTIADGFTFEFPYNPYDQKLRELTRPFAYKSADLFIGGELYIAGQQIKWSPAVRENERLKTVDVRTRAGHTIECMAQKRALQFDNQKLSEIATAILQPYGDKMRPVFLSGDSDRFTKVRKEITDTDFAFLSGIAQQKGFLMTSSDDGSIAFLRANIDGKPVFRFIEGESGIENITATYDGQQRFSSYQAVTEVAGRSGPIAILNDESIPAYRPFVFSADDLESGNLDTALQWRRSKALADACRLSLVVTGWRNQYGQLWRENMKGTVLYPSADIFKETDYIISGVDLTKDQNGGNVSRLELVMTQAYSLEFPDSFPWEG